MEAQPQSLEEAIKLLEENRRKVIAYDKQRERMINYQKKNPDKCREKSNKYYLNIKENPEKYNELKEKKRQYYNEVVKNKKTMDQPIECTVAH
jgi:hypothetical protein